MDNGSKIKAREEYDYLAVRIHESEKNRDMINDRTNKAISIIIILNFILSNRDIRKRNKMNI